MRAVGGSVGSDGEPEPTDPVNDFWRAIAEDTATMASLEAGEVLDYYPGGDTSVEPVRVPCLVMREDAYVDGEAGFRRQPIVLDVPGPPAFPGGISMVDEGADVVDVPLRFGRPPTRCRVVKVASQTRGVFELEVER